MSGISRVHTRRSGRSVWGHVGVGIKAVSSVLYRQSAGTRNSKRKKRDGRGDPRPGLLYLLPQKQETSDGCLPPRGEGQINRGLPNTCVGIIVYRTPSQARGKIQMGTMMWVS